MIFCDIVSQVSGARSPIVAGLALSFLEEEPVKLNIYGLESLDCNVVGYYFQSCCVIGLHMCGGLFVPHFLKSIPLWDGLSEIYEEGADLCFLCR